jgi:hypothetical protein
MGRLAVLAVVAAIALQRFNARGEPQNPELAAPPVTLSVERFGEGDAGRLPAVYARVKAPTGVASARTHGRGRSVADDSRPRDACGADLAQLRAKRTTGARRLDESRATRSR